MMLLYITKCFRDLRLEHIHELILIMSLDFTCSLLLMPEGQNILILSLEGQNFKMITSAKHEG